MEVLGDLLIFVFAGDECKLPLAHLALLGLCSGAVCDDLVDLLVVQVTRHRKISVHLRRLVVYLSAQVVGLPRLHFLLFFARFVVRLNVHLGVRQVQVVVI